MINFDTCRKLELESKAAVSTCCAGLSNTSFGDVLYSKKFLEHSILASDTTYQTTHWQYSAKRRWPRKISCLSFLLSGLPCLSEKRSAGQIPEISRGFSPSPDEPRTLSGKILPTPTSPRVPQPPVERETSEESVSLNFGHPGASHLVGEPWSPRESRSPRAETESTDDLAVRIEAR